MKYVEVYLKDGFVLDFDKKCNKTLCNGDGIIWFQHAYHDGLDGVDNLGAVPIENIRYIIAMDE